MSTTTTAKPQATPQPFACRTATLLARVLNRAVARELVAPSEFEFGERLDPDVVDELAFEEAYDLLRRAPGSCPPRCCGSRRIVGRQREGGR